MIKGVNKQIVEINYTKDEFIEKAILIINPQKSRLPQSLITQKADHYMQGLLPELESGQPSVPPPAPRPRHRKRIFLAAVFSMSFLGIIAYLISLLL